MEKGKDLKGRASKKSTQSHSKEAHQWRAHNTSVPPMGSTSAREMKEGAIKRQPRKTTKPQPLRLGRKEPSEKHSVMHNKNGKATTRKVRLVKGKSWADNTKSPVEGAASKPKETHLIATDSDEEDNEPIAKRMCRPFQHVGSPHDEKQANDEVNVKHEKTPAKIDPSILSLRCPKSEELWKNIEQGQHTRKTPTPSPTQSVHPRLKNLKLDKSTEKLVQGWILNASLDKEQPLAKYESRPYLVLLRKDLWTLKARSWVNNNIILWMCYIFNGTASSRFRRDFYCVCPGILEMVMHQRNLDAFHDTAVPVYIGLGANFGEDTRFFNKVEAAKRKWWLIPICLNNHWWLYAFEVANKRMLVLDPMHSEAPDAGRNKLDAYAGRLVEDMAKVAIPSYERTTHGLPRAYAKVPKQPNSYDCGIYVIKFMERWTEDGQLDAWDNDILKSIRWELMLDIIMGPQNLLVDQVRTLLEAKDVPLRRNHPKNKCKEVSTPFTAPRTRTLVQQAEGLPMKRTNKERKK
ncbi:uncharacterized protein DS421_2g53600 [Arachis hypogaea]|nr:uncharacterized protein DS421_2g53600 [Arachis hypogaea]